MVWSILGFVVVWFIGFALAVDVAKNFGNNKVLVMVVSMLSWVYLALFLLYALLVSVIDNLKD
jgi:hypothetical protein